MIHKGKLADFLDPFTLRFKLKTLEERHLQEREGRVRGVTLQKMYIAVMTAIQFGLTLYDGIMARRRGDEPYYQASIISAIVGASCVILEFLLHCCPNLRMFRGILCNAGTFFATFIFSASKLNYPGLTLGYVPLFTHFIFVAAFPP